MISVLILSLFPATLLAQHAVDPSQRYFRLIALVHMTGSGKKDDPIRPEYAPSAAEMSRDGIVSWSLQLTDDKHMAIVHLVAVNHHAFDAILKDKRPEILIFEPGKTGKTAIETALKLVKKDFSLDTFQVMAR